MDASFFSNPPFGLVKICRSVSEQARTDALQAFALSDVNDPQVAQLAEAVRRRARSQSTADLAAEALNAVQSLEYHSHKLDGYDYFARPAYVLSVGGGNCEDLSVVLVALCKNLGIDARCVWIDQPKSSLNHVATQLYVEGQWLWADPSIWISDGGGAKLGEHPQVALARLALSGHISDLQFRPKRPYLSISYGVQQKMNPRYPIPITHPAGALTVNLRTPTAGDRITQLRSTGLIPELGPPGTVTPGTATDPSTDFPPEATPDSSIVTTGENFLTQEYAGLPVWAWGLIGLAVGGGAYYAITHLKK